MVVNYVRVQNQSLPIEIFNALCDRLSLLRHCCTDYRMVQDFKVEEEKPYWHSYSYPTNCTIEIQAALAGVRDDVNRFGKKVGFDPNSVLVEIASATIVC